MRIQVKTWLDCNKDDELLLAEHIDQLKRERSFAKTFRDGIRLICELRQGKTDLLFSLFPDLRQHLTPPPAPPDNSDLKAELRRLQDMILRSSGQPLMVDNLPSMFVKGDTKASAGESRKVFAAGVGDLFADDDEDDLILEKTHKTGAAKSFLASIGALTTSH
ncbi:MAG: hypothetical protein IT297_08640 [Anaerolineae bacterium]|nr:hypothetical protein [Anaerolineae bacterium]